MRVQNRATQETILDSNSDQQITTVTISKQEEE